MKKYVDSLRFKFALAKLQDLNIHKQEAALMREIGKDRSWGVDAAITAIEKSGHDFSKLDMNAVFGGLAMQGNLRGLQRLCDVLGMKEGAAREWLNPLLTAFDTAVAHGHYTVADFCLSRGAHTNFAYPNGARPRAMDIAIEERDLKKIGYLFDKGESPDHHLTAALIANDIKLVRFFVERGADVSAASGHQAHMTPILQAVAYAGNDVIDYLITKGADPKAQNDEILLYAIAQGKASVDKFLALGLAPTQRHLFEAISLGKLDVAESFVAQGLEVDAPKLFVAIISKDPEDKIAFCLRHGVDVRGALRDIENLPCLYENTGREKIVSFLQNQVAKLDAEKPMPKGAGPRR